MIEAFVNGAVRLWHDNSLKFRTYTGGVIGDQNIWVGSDNYKLLVGGGADLQIYHNGTKSIIDNNTGDLSIETTANEVHSVQSEFQVKVKKGGDEDGWKSYN